MAEPPKPDGRSRWKRLLTLAGFVAIFGCCVVPEVVCRPAVDVSAFWPVQGSTMDDVRAKYGPPSESYPKPDGTATWFYYTDGWGLGFTAVGVRFDAAGRVETSFNH